jgi:hypothetical protein
MPLKPPSRKRISRPTQKFVLKPNPVPKIMLPKPPPPPKKKFQTIVAWNNEWIWALALKCNSVQNTELQSKKYTKLTQRGCLLWWRVCDHICQLKSPKSLMSYIFLPWMQILHTHTHNQISYSNNRDVHKVTLPLSLPLSPPNPCSTFNIVICKVRKWIWL